MTSFITISRDTVTDVIANENARYKRNTGRVLLIATGIHTKIGTNGFQKRLESSIIVVNVHSFFH